MRVLVLMLGLIFCFSCSSDRKNLIPKDDLVDILIEIHLTEAIFTATRIKDAKFAYVDSMNIYDSIISRYGYNTAMYDSTLKYYSYHVQKFETIYDKVIEELNRREGEVLDSIKKRSVR